MFSEAELILCQCFLYLFCISCNRMNVTSPQLAESLLTNLFRPQSSLILVASCPQNHATTSCSFILLRSETPILPTGYPKRTNSQASSYNPHPRVMRSPPASFKPVSSHKARPAASHVQSSHKIGITIPFRSAHFLIPAAAASPASVATYQVLSAVFFDPTPPTTKIQNNSLGARRQLLFNSELRSAVFSIWDNRGKGAVAAGRGKRTKRLYIIAASLVGSYVLCSRKKCSSNSHTDGSERRRCWVRFRVSARAPISGDGINPCECAATMAL